MSRKVYIIGGGIAGLAAAALSIRDGGLRGEQVHVLEQQAFLGGSLDGAGNPHDGYVIRGGRMFEEHFACTFDLFATIPTVADPAVSVSDETMDFTRRIRTSSNARLVADRQRIEAPPLGLGLRQQFDLLRLSLTPEARLAGRTIDAYFDAAFFETSFWLMWCTMFAFQPWHSLAEFRRYMRRFMHLLPGFNRLEGIHRTRLNQYDSLVVPLARWLEAEGAQLETGAQVADVRFAERVSGTVVAGIDIATADGLQSIDVGEDDLVFITLGSMTEDAALGDHGGPARPEVHPDAGAWALWRRIAEQLPDAAGRPEVFCGDVARSKWLSFTVTLADAGFFDFMERFTHNAAGTGGLVTLRDSSWRMSVVLAHQPHFANQPEGVHVFWGYGLLPDKPGDAVGKAMSDCSGAELLEELLHHLPREAAGLLDDARCVPCIMPFITSQFMPRAAGDRPAVTPLESANFAFLGQFCELAEDTVFTVEYSVRSARVAVSNLLGTAAPPPIYPGYRNPRVLLRALRALSRRSPSRRE